MFFVMWLCHYYLLSLPVLIIVQALFPYYAPQLFCPETLAFLYIGAPICVAFGYIASRLMSRG